LAASLEANHVFFVTLEEQKEENAKKFPEHCEPKLGTKGSAAAPTAAPGYLCVYEGFDSEAPTGTVYRFIEKLAPAGSSIETGANTAGAQLDFFHEGAGSQVLEIKGTWAVTAE
jgi:hypothetical protein